MEKNTEDVLPLGSVVMLEGGQKKLMITGYYMIDHNKRDKIWDYNGCLYPEGVLETGKTLLFDHSQIKEVYFNGYSDDDDAKYKERLKEFSSELNKALENMNNNNNN